MAKNDLRPDHYKEGEDTFAWAERKFSPETCLAIAAFNIHKYNDRDKGQDYKDFGKIADYAMWARGIMERDEAEVKSTKRDDSIDAVKYTWNFCRSGGKSNYQYTTILAELIEKGQVNVMCMSDYDVFAKGFLNYLFVNHEDRFIVNVKNVDGVANIKLVSVNKD
jgi:hypothetical protein